MGQGRHSVKILITGLGLALLGASARASDLCTVEQSKAVLSKSIDFTQQGWHERSLDVLAGCPKMPNPWDGLADYQRAKNAIALGDATSARRAADRVLSRSNEFPPNLIEAVQALVRDVPVSRSPIGVDGRIQFGFASNPQLEVDDFASTRADAIVDLELLPRVTLSAGNFQFKTTGVLSWNELLDLPEERIQVLGVEQLFRFARPDGDFEIAIPWLATHRASLMAYSRWKPRLSLGWNSPIGRWSFSARPTWTHEWVRDYQNVGGFAQEAAGAYEQVLGKIVMSLEYAQGVDWRTKGFDVALKRIPSSYQFQRGTFKLTYAIETEWSVAAEYLFETRDYLDYTIIGAIKPTRHEFTNGFVLGTRYAFQVNTTGFFQVESVSNSSNLDTSVGNTRNFLNIQFALGLEWKIN